MVGFIRSHLGTLRWRVWHGVRLPPHYVSTLLSRETGRTFREHVTSARMDGAKMLLECTDMTVEEVAGTVGYASTSNFSQGYRRTFRHNAQGPF